MNEANEKRLIASEIISQLLQAREIDQIKLLLGASAESYRRLNLSDYKQWLDRQTNEVNYNSQAS
jgi:hypothetical protein